MHLSHRITGIALAVVFLNACAFLPADAQTTKPTNAHDQVLDRVRLLKNLKNTYQFRLRDLMQDLRDKAMKLSIDGMGTPGRLSTKEIEISELTRQTLEAQDSRAQAKAVLDALQKKNQPDAAIQLQIEEDHLLNDYARQIGKIDLKLAEGNISSDEVGRLQNGKAALEAKAKKRRADLSTLFSQAKVESLQNTIDTADQRLAELTPRLKKAKADLGKLNYQMSQYLSAKDEAKATQKQLDQVNRMLTQLSVLQQMSSFLNESELHDLDRQILGLSPAPPPR